jgi:2'-5' RNA ligase
MKSRGKPMAKIAVDIVLLPSEQTMDRVIEINKELSKQYPDKIILNKENCLPHVSLAMGCIDEADRVTIERILRSIAEVHPPGRLHVEGIQTGFNAKNEKVALLQLRRTEQLQSLHEIVMQELASYLSYDVSADMVLSPPSASESTLLWIKHYREKSSFEKFSPHITLGYGQIDNLSFACEVTAPELALCRLGNHCTCREILSSAKFLR